jgi:hypothetical protein
VVRETIELLFRTHEVVILDRDSAAEELLFRIAGSTLGVGTIEGVETTELVFITYAEDPAEAVGTTEGVETDELRFTAEGVEMAEEDAELCTN